LHKVAAVARKRQVLGIVASSVLARPNMLDVECRVNRRLWQATILAPIDGAAPHKAACRSIH